MITLQDLQAAGLNFTQDQYDRLVADASDPARTPSIRVLLKQYAPDFVDAGAFYGSTVDRFDVLEGKVYFVNPTDRRLISERSWYGGTTWAGGDYFGDSSPIMQASCGRGPWADGSNNALCSYIVGNTVKAFNITLDSTQFFNWTNSASVTLKHIALASSSSHLIGTTPNGNWRFGYAKMGEATIKWSDIYWPYQVRSFDAIRTTKGYDVIAMITDLPPITDVSTSGTHTVTTYQRVQGIVLFKYDYLNNIWSDHVVFDVCDNTAETLRANVKLTSSGEWVYLTYSKGIGSEFGVAISRSLDGWRWEDPLFFHISEWVSMNDARSFALDGSFLIGGDRTFHSVMTEFAGGAQGEAVQDVTSHVTGLSLDISKTRNATISLDNPEGVLDSGLLGTGRLLRAVVELGYWSNGEELRIPVITGDVIGVERATELPVKTATLTVRDSTQLPQFVGSSEAQEWYGLSFGGDNFAPTIEEDAVGTSGMGHVATLTGTWTGGNKDSKDHGLRLQGNGTEGVIASTTISRAMCGQFSSEISFYKPLEAVNMPTGAPVDSLISGEYAGLSFRAQDRHNLWWVKFIPANGTSTFQLLRRIGTMTGDTPSYTDVVCATASGVTMNGSYSNYYSGRLTIVWRYNLISVYRNYPGGDAVRILQYEAKGMGDLTFGAKSNDATVYPATEGGNLYPTLAGSAGYIGYSNNAGWIDRFTNGDAEGADLSKWVQRRPGSTLREPVSRSTTIKASGAASFRLHTMGDMVRPGMYYLSDTFAKADAAIRFSADVYREIGDDDASVVVWGRAIYSDGTFSDTSPLTITSKNPWVHWNAEMTAAGKTVTGAQAWFQNPNGPHDSDHVYYVDNLHAHVREKVLYIYFGNSDLCDARPVYTAHDALHTLYAYAGAHKIARKLALSHGAVGTGTTYLQTAIPLPYVATFKIAATSGSIGLRSRGSGAEPVVFSWQAGKVSLTVQSSATKTFTRTLPVSISAGSVLRIAVTTQRNEGKLFKNDQSGVQDWITVAIYVGDAFLIACSAPLYDSAFLGDKLCLSGAAPISSIAIDELHRLQEFFSVDPKETVSSGLSRVVGQSRAVMLARFDDTICIGRPNIRFAPAQWAVIAAAAQKAAESQSYQSPVHYRIVGAWDERDVIDHDGMQRLWRHFFNKAEDPNLMTSNELSTEAAYVLTEMRARQRLSIQAGFNPFVEYSDSVTYTPYGEAAQTMLIESERISVTLGQGNAPVVAVEIGLNSGGL